MSDIWSRNEAEDALAALQGRKLPKGLLAALINGEYDASVQTGVASIIERFVETPESDDVEDDAEALWAVLTSRGGVELTLSSIELQNFLIFRQAVIDTRADPVRPVVVVEGKNGYGKSSLIKAVRFVLAHDDESSEIAHLIHKNSPGNQAEAKVVLTFTGDMGDFDIRRVKTYRRSSGTWLATGEDHLVVNRKPKALHGEEALKWIREHFPERLLNYYVFDAESKIVSELAGQRGTELPPVKEALETALNITPLRRTAEACLSLSREKASTIAKTYRESQKQKKLKTENEERLSDLEAEIEEVSIEVKSLQKQLAQAEVEVERYGGKAQPELQERRESLLREKEKFSAKIADAERRRKKALAECLPMALLGLLAPQNSAPSSPNKSVEWRRGAEEASESIAGLISSGRFSWASNTPPAGDLACCFREAMGLVREADTSRDEKKQALARVRSMTRHSGGELREWLDSDRLSLLYERLGDIERELRETPTPHDTRKWHEEHVKATTERNSILQRLDARRRYLEGLHEDKRQLEASSMESQELPSRSPELRRLRRFQTLSETASEALNALADELLGRRVKQLEKDASTMLVRTAHKHSVLSEIRVDPKTYRYAVYNRNGNPAPVGRSTGEKNLLALCLVHAIRKAAGSGLPLMVEAPLRVLDPVHRSSVLKEILCQYPGQMILLLTPEEIPDELAPVIRDRVGRKLFLIRDGSEEEEVSKVLETKF